MLDLAPTLGIDLNFTVLEPILVPSTQSHDKGDQGMDWKKLLGSISESVNDDLRLRIAYLITEI